MTGHKMARRHLDQGRRLDLASLDCVRASRVEVAARGAVHRAWRVARNDGHIVPPCNLRQTPEPLHISIDPAKPSCLV